MPQNPGTPTEVLAVNWTVQLGQVGPPGQAEEAVVLSFLGVPGDDLAAGPTAVVNVALPPGMIDDLYAKLPGSGMLGRKAAP
jgi:hypothetical protein